MKKIFLLTALAVLLFTSCGNDTAPTGNTDSAADTTATTDSGLKDKQAKAQFVIETTLDSMEIPHSTVSVDYNDKRAALDPITCAAALYNKDEMKQMDIPADAIAACGGWYAGGGDYYYIVPTPTGIAVYKGWLDEGVDDVGYHWEKVKDIN